jgi:hypothetical protein
MTRPSLRPRSAMNEQPGKPLTGGKVSEPQPLNDGPGHSDIFDRLAAGNETDLIGLVAYGLYQRRKRCWIKDFQEKTGRYPSAADREFYAFGYRDDAISALRQEAEGVMATFGEQTIEGQLPELRRDALNAETQAVLSSIDNRINHLNGYGHHIVGHLVGFLVLVGGFAVLALILHFEPTLANIYHWFTDELG